MSSATPTRSNLLALKGEKQLATDGSNLLKNKRDALVKDFFKFVSDCVALREQLEKDINGAMGTLELAKAIIGEEALRSFAFASRRDISLDMTVENIWGLGVPKIEEKDLRRRMDERGVSPIGESPWAMDVSRRFEEIVTEIIGIASRETKLKMLGEEIKMTTRRVNALDEMIIPEITKTIRSISTVLEEREREDIYRLKRFKKRKM
ncbi:MAG: V-type ATP synthase subunit D [Thermodesulfobacteriota bacterium]